MNILFINTSATKGGAARVALDIKNGLEKIGHTTSMFVAGSSDTSKNIYTLPRPGLLSRILARIIHNPLSYYPSDKILATKEFRDTSVVHCHNLHGNFFKLATLQKIAQRKPVVWTLHDMWPITPYCAYSYDETPDQEGFYSCDNTIEPQTQKYDANSLKRIKRAIYQDATLTIVTPSLWLKKKVEGSILRDKPIVHIPNGIDTTTFIARTKKSAREKLGIPTDKKVIMFLSAGGKQDARKGWRYAEAVQDHYKNNPSVYMITVGGSTKLTEKQAGRDIPYLADSELLSYYYSAADVFLFTSLRENFPLAVLEAMSCGTPVVSFDVGGVAESVTHKQHGYIARYKDTGDLIAGVDFIFSLSADEGRKMSEDTQTQVQAHYTLEKMVAAYESLYKEIKKTYEI